MTIILSGINTLDKHISEFYNNPERYRPSQCPHCSKSGVWMHGVYYRNAQCEKGVGCSAPIQRFFCPACEQTCSALPEYIPPLRWYHWAVQQVALELLMSGYSLVEAWIKMSVLLPGRLKLPSRSTLQRWQQNLRQQFPYHQFHLCNLYPEFGRFQHFQAFLKICFDKFSLSKMMLILNHSGHPIP